MIDSINASPLYPIANPKSIAVFGASNSITSMGTSLLDSILDLGFEGDLYPIHPKENKVQNLKAYRSVLDLPNVPDLAMIVLPTHIVAQALDACGRKGIRHAMIISGGFKEVGGEGIDLEKELVAVANKYGIRFLGPNCIGVANPRGKLNTTFMSFQGIPGYIGMASQSGSFVTQMFGYLSDYGLGFSTAISVGNEANIDIVDCIEYLGACPDTRVIALYIEGIRRGRAFVEMARSIVPKKPIVALYIGGSEAGSRAGLSHTGALAGPDRLYEGIFRQSGIIRAHSAMEMFDICWMLGCFPGIKDRRVVVQTHSGGPGAEAADACGRAGLELPSLSPETIKRLRPFIPRTGSISNPIDYTFGKNLIDYFSEIPKALLDEKNADVLLFYFFAPTQRLERMMKQSGVPPEQIKEQVAKLVNGYSEAMMPLFESHKKPLVGYTFQNVRDPLVKFLIDRGVPIFSGPQRAARAIEAAFQYSRLRERILADLLQKGRNKLDSE
ncbi:MAG: CoA-binding protein [Deltaproteobacteria bacterium]|nr:CoA-binding protein [Deltaproteobacteria bacterium]